MYFLTILSRVKIRYLKYINLANYVVGIQKIWVGFEVETTIIMSSIEIVEIQCRM